MTAKVEVKEEAVEAEGTKPKVTVKSVKEQVTEIQKEMDEVKEQVAEVKSDLNEKEEVVSVSVNREKVENIKQKVRAKQPMLKVKKAAKTTGLIVLKTGLYVGGGAGGFVVGTYAGPVLGLLMGVSIADDVVVAMDRRLDARKAKNQSEA